MLILPEGEERGWMKVSLEFTCPTTAWGGFSSCLISSFRPLRKTTEMLKTKKTLQSLNISHLSVLHCTSLKQMLNQCNTISVMYFPLHWIQGDGEIWLRICISTYTGGRGGFQEGHKDLYGTCRLLLRDLAPGPFPLLQFKVLPWAYGMFLSLNPPTKTPDKKFILTHRF